jgi:hypothetical protein
VVGGVNLKLFFSTEFSFTALLIQVTNAMYQTQIYQYILYLTGVHFETCFLIVQASVVFYGT